MTTYTLPQDLGDILGAHHDGNLQTQVSEIKSGIGVLARGTILATGGGADIGKLVKLTAGTEAQSYGILLDPSIDTSQAFSDGSVTGSIAKAGSFRGPALIVPAGIDSGLVSVALRGRGIFVGGRGAGRIRICVKLSCNFISKGRYFRDLLMTFPMSLCLHTLPSLPSLRMRSHQSVTPEIIKRIWPISKRKVIIQTTR